MSGRTPTFADICSAIAEGQLAAAVEGAVYQVNALELRRYLNRFRPLPTISSVLDASDTDACAGTPGWSPSSRPSIA